MKHPKRGKKRVWHSFRHALSGIAYVINTQPNMQIHLTVASLILVLAIFLDIPVSHLLWVVFAIFFVLCMETLNTAIERTVDLITTGYHPLAKLAKDIAAGCVLFASIFAVVTGAVVFGEPLLAYVPIDFHLSYTQLMLIVILLFLFVLCVITWWKKKR